MDQGCAWRGGGWRAAASPTPKSIFKNTDFVGIMILNILQDLPLSHNKLLKLADDQYIRILKNIVKLGVS
jgi:hypothetical protein